METLWFSKRGSRLGLLLVLAAGCSGDGPTGPTDLDDPAAPAVATITVTPSGPAMDVGQSQQLGATLRDAGGNVLVGRTITWMSSDTAIAIVDATGLVQGVAPGQAMITAMSEGKTGIVNVTIRSAGAAVATITITPGSLTLTIGEAQHLTATLQDAAGNALAGRTISWTSSNAAIATIDATGLVRGVNPGQATITATSEGKTASATVTVRLPVSGQEIAFNSDRDGNSEIYLMHPDGTGLVNVTRHPADDSRPTWSPDGSKIAFVSNRDGDDEIYSMNADGSNVVRLTHHPGFDGEPSWSGSKIAFTGVGDSCPCAGNEVYVMNGDGTNLVNVTNSIGSDGGPSWSSDGMRIAFHSDRDFDIDFTELWEEIFVMNADGTNPVNVTNHDTAQDVYPEWSPDGTRIVFHRLLLTDGGSSLLPGEIWVMQADGANPVNLTNNPAGDYLPSWSPDGTKIIFASDRDGNNEIYVMNADGTGIQRLTSHPAADFWPAWRP